MRVVWALDTNLVIDLFEGDPARKTPVMMVAHEAVSSKAVLAVTSVTIHEFLARPAMLGEEAWGRAREFIDEFEPLVFDEDAARRAAMLQLQRLEKEYLKTGAESRTEAKKWWFRDAAIIGACLSKGVGRLFTRDGYGPMGRSQRIEALSIVAV